MTIQGSSEVTTSAPATAPASYVDVLKPFAVSAARHGLTVLAGALLAHGLVNQNGAEQIAAAAPALVALGWSWWDKRGRAMLLADVANLRAILQAKADAARAQRAGAGTIASVQAKRP